MKSIRTATLILAAATFLGGCSDSDERSAPARAGTDREADIRSVIEMQRRGEIDESQALKLVAAMTGARQDAPQAASAPRPIVFTAAAEAPKKTVPAPASGRAAITGRLRSVGSDSMDRIMEDWTKTFADKNPGLRVSHEGKGSSTAVPALLEGRADFGPMSRPLKKEEIDLFSERFGYEPTQIRVALDTVAVYVNPANPIAKTGLSMKQLDAVFSSTRNRGGARVVTWGDLGLTGAWKDAPVRVYSRNSDSGTHAFFRDEVLVKGEFRDDATMLAGSEELVKAVAGDRFAIGYSGIGYRNGGVAVVNIAAKNGEPWREPDETNAVSGAYPISRALYVTLNRKPGSPASALQHDFIAYILSPEGQETVKREGYFAVPAKEIPAELAKLGS